MIKKFCKVFAFIIFFENGTLNKPAASIIPILHPAPNITRQINLSTGFELIFKPGEFQRK